MCNLYFFVILSIKHITYFLKYITLILALAQQIKANHLICKQHIVFIILHKCFYA